MTLYVFRVPQSSPIVSHALTLNALGVTLTFTSSQVRVFRVVRRCKAAFPAVQKLNVCLVLRDDTRTLSLLIHWKTLAHSVRWDAAHVKMRWTAPTVLLVSTSKRKQASSNAKCARRHAPRANHKLSAPVAKSVSTYQLSKTECVQSAKITAQFVNRQPNAFSAQKAHFWKKISHVNNAKRTVCIATKMDVWNAASVSTSLFLLTLLFFLINVFHVCQIVCTAHQKVLAWNAVLASNWKRTHHVPLALMDVSLVIWIIWLIWLNVCPVQSASTKTT